MIVVFAVIAAVFGAPPQRSERAIVYSNHLVGSPYAYSAGAVPLAYSSEVYSGAPAISAYSPYQSVYNGVYPSNGFNYVY